MITDLKTHVDLPWLVGGDLNEVFYHCEKVGGPPRSQAHLEAFRNAFLGNNLYDLGFSGYNFTWCNNHDGEDVVGEWLDRFCTTTEWSLCFPDACVQHVDSYISVHLPILLRCKPQTREKNRRATQFNSKVCGHLIRALRRLFHQRGQLPWVRTQWIIYF